MIRFRVSHRATIDLAKIQSYIAVENPSAVDALIDALFDAFQAIARDPELGERRPEITPDPIRMFSVKNYVIFYRPRRDFVEIVRVVHGARDLYSLF
jgi:toxin ParE1/3/4